MSELSNELNLVVSTDSDSVSINQQNIRLDLIEGYEDCSDQQKRYLQQFANDPERKTLHAMQLGYTTSTVDGWFGQQEFSNVATVIERIYTEELKSLDQKDAVTNSKIRNRVIQFKERGSYLADKQTTENHLHLDTSFKDVMKLLDNSD